MPIWASRVRLHRMALASALATLLAAPAVAQDTSASMQRANRMAYQSAMKCFVANGIVVSDARDARNSAKETAFDAKAKQSFDLAHLAGHELGVSQARIAVDLKSAQDAEMPRMMRDAGYFKETVAHCKSLGLM